ncbi:CHAT domain-containing protein [Nonomuraea bangladeshensis]|uniref:CHAT domain-containing protein n=1 Tax=Nonomuraea bangladeshensis TaxID=404385 RepID=UPI003C2AE3EB
MTDAPALDAVIDALKLRIDRFDSDDEAAVLDGEGSALLTRAWELCEQSELSAYTALVLAHFHWRRHQALPEGGDGSDWAYAMELFSALRRAVPEEVPAPISDFLATHEDARGTAYNYCGAQLFDEFERTGAPAALDNAVDMFAKAVAAGPADRPGQRQYLSNLAGACLARFGIAGDRGDLDVAIELGFQAAGLDGGDEEIRAATLGNLATALRTRYEHAGDLSDLDAAVGLLRDTFAVLPSGHPHVNTYLASLSTLLRTRFAATQVRADLDEALDAAQRAVESLPSGDPDRPTCLSSLAVCALTRYQRYRAASDLDTAIDAGAAAVRETPVGQPDRLGYLTNFSIALRERYLMTDSLDDLDSAVGAAREAVSGAPPRAAVRPALLSNLALQLRTRASRTGGVADMDAAVSAAGEAVTAATGGPSWPTMLGNYAAALLVRFETTGDPADLDAAVQAADTAAEAVPTGHPERAARSSDLSSTLLTRYTSRGDRADLDAAVADARDAVALARPDHPQLGRYLSNLAYALRLRADAYDDLADLDAAVQAGEEAVARLPVGHPERAGYLVNLASASASRFERTGHWTDLDRAVERSREAVEQTSDGHADLPGRWNNLALILRVRFERSGRLADADEAVMLGRRVLATVPPEHAERCRYLTNLAATLHVRYRQTHDLTDLDEAVEAAREAVAALPPTHPERGGYLSNLGNALRVRFDERNDVHDLAAAREATQLAVAVTPRGADRAKYLSNLSAVLLSTVEHDPGRSDALVAAIEAAEEAVEITASIEQSDRGRYLANLGNALITRGSSADLARAATVTAEAVRSSPPDHPDHAAFLFTAGHALHAADPSGRVPEAWRAAARSRTGATEVRLRAAWAWGTAAATANDAADAADAFATAVSLLPVLAWRGLDQAVREEHLWRWAGLASDACAWALRAGEPRRAVELLEQGRSITWQQIVQTHADLTAARAAAPELAARLDELREALDAPASVTGHDDVLPVLDRERDAQVRRRLAEEWDDVVESIRGVAGLETFLTAVPYEKLAAEAAHGPIVFVNLSRYGCCAIALTGSEPVVIDLPALTRASAVDRANLLLQTRLTAEKERTFANARAAHRALVDVLAWLYDTIAAPVLAALAPVLEGADGDRRLPRVWWCPTGPLTMLPLHAAGHYSGAAADTLLNRVVSSYLPTISALHRARTAGAAGPPARALVVAPSTTYDDLRPLPFAAREAGKVRQHLPDGEDLSEAAATADTVLTELSRHSWVHLSCHGRQHPTDPAGSALYLHDRPLTVAEIAGHRFAGGQLAYLSACETFTGGVRVLDEAMHLSAAFQVAGFRHVIATLWTIIDERSMAIADDVYASLTEDGTADPTKAARALHAAVMRLRAQYPHAPSLWAPYVHSGP